MCVLNIAGQVIWCEKLNDITPGNFSKQVDMSTFPNGIYFVKLTNNTEHKTMKVVIQ